MNEDLFEDGDPFQDPAWQRTGKRGSRRRVAYIGCPLSWFGWVMPLVKSKRQLAFVLLLYRRCCICQSATVTVPTEVFENLGISRRQKRTQLLALEAAEVIRVEATQNGWVGKITLVNWPEPA
jgi:hypothetical protein